MGRDGTDRMTDSDLDEMEAERFQQVHDLTGRVLRQNAELRKQLAIERGRCWAAWLEIAKLHEHNRILCTRYEEAWSEYNQLLENMKACLR